MLRDMIDIGGVIFKFCLPQNANVDGPVHQLLPLGYPTGHAGTLRTLAQTEVVSEEADKFRRDSTAKPPLSYAQLIAEAINSSPAKKLNLAGIYAYISEHYAY